MIFDANLFDFDPEARSYTQELSTLQIAPASPMPHLLTLRNCPATGQVRSFVLSRTDRSGGDVDGWYYREAPGPNRGRSWDNGHPPKSVEPLSVLFIND